MFDGKTPRWKTRFTASIRVNGLDAPILPYNMGPYPLCGLGLAPPIPLFFLLTWDDIYLTGIKERKQEKSVQSINDPKSYHFKVMNQLL